jgi:hypothetical protein
MKPKDGEGIKRSGFGVKRKVQEQRAADNQAGARGQTWESGMRKANSQNCADSNYSQ